MTQATIHNIEEQLAGLLDLPNEWKLLEQNRIEHTSGVQIWVHGRKDYCGLWSPMREDFTSSGKDALWPKIEAICKPLIDATLQEHRDLTLARLSGEAAPPWSADELNRMAEFAKGVIQAWQVEDSIGRAHECDAWFTFADAIDIHVMVDEANEHDVVYNAWGYRRPLREGRAPETQDRDCTDEVKLI